LFNLFTTAGACYFVAELGDKIVGGCGIYPTPNLPKGCAELVKFYLKIAQFHLRKIMRL